MEVTASPLYVVNDLCKGLPVELFKEFDGALFNVTAGTGPVSGS